MEHRLPAYIRVVSVSKSFREGYKRRDVLHELSAEFQKGEFIALVGKSGSGKSTLLNLIAGIDDADSGEIFVGDLELTGCSEPAKTLFRRQHVGFIFQSFQLIPFLNVRDNINFLLRLNGISIQSEKDRLNALTKKVGIDSLMEAFPEKLSGGEQQRVAIVRALAHRPSLILADEPTGNLDEGNGEEIIDILSKLTRETATTLLVVTHSVEVAKKADRTFRVQHGRLEKA